MKNGRFIWDAGWLTGLAVVSYTCFLTAAMYLFTFWPTTVLKWEYYSTSTYQTRVTQLVVVGLVAMALNLYHVVQCTGRKST